MTAPDQTPEPLPFDVPHVMTPAAYKAFTADHYTRMAREAAEQSKQEA